MTDNRRKSDQAELIKGRKNMRKIVVSEFVTLDGVLEDPGGAEKFEHGGWAFKFQRGPEGDKFKMDEILTSDAFLLGRVTYEGFASAWPSRTGEFADMMNNTPKYVVSTTLKNPAWKNTTVINGNVVEEISKLKAMPGRDILVAGSARLVSTLLEHDLIDELRLMMFPIILGKGKRLFTNGKADHALQLADARPVGNEGVITLVYHSSAGDKLKNK
jgi:dihydrofolate reductase